MVGGLKGLLEQPAIKAAAQVRHMATKFNCAGHSPDPLTIQQQPESFQGLTEQALALKCAEVIDSAKNTGEGGHSKKHRS